MKILKNIEILEEHLGLFIKDESALVIADLHIGYEAALEKQGIQIPRSQYPKIKEEVKKMIESCEPELLIINGDVKHEFGEATKQEWREVLDFLNFLLSKNIRIIVVRGNHDNFLIPILRKRNIELKDPWFILGNYLFVHGHKEIHPKILDAGVSTVIMAHEHPAIVLRDELGVKRKFKCFLKGKLYGKDLVVLPALSPLMEGSEINVLDEKSLLSPLLRTCDLRTFDSFVVEPNVGIYKFPLGYV